MADFVALHQAQSAVVDEAMNGSAGRATGNKSATGEPSHGKAELKLTLEAAVADEMIVDDAVRDGETESRDEQILDLFPHKCRIDFIVFHV